jgi:hypothetical protein
MTDFKLDIEERLTRLTKANELMGKKLAFQKAYFKCLIDIDWKEVVTPDDFQTSFLDLLSERYNALFKEIEELLKSRFYEMYSGSEDENEAHYNPKDELSISGIQLPSPTSNEWQLMYEMRSDDTIFHVEFNGWTFKMIGITH